MLTIRITDLPTNEVKTETFLGGTLAVVQGGGSTGVIRYSHGRAGGTDPAEYTVFSSHAATPATATGLEVPDLAVTDVLLEFC